MRDIGFFEVVILVSLIVLLYFFYRDLNRKKYLGDLLAKAPRDFDSKASTALWVILGCFWIFFLIERSVNMGPHDRHPIQVLLLPVIWILITSQHILKFLNDKEIREKGITTKEGFIHWEDIISYRWTIEEELEITFQLRVPFNSNRSVTKFWTINKEDKAKIDEIFAHHVKSNQEEK